MPASGALRRKLRKAQGLPRFTESDLRARHKYAKNKYKKNRDFLWEYKMAKGCADCGFNDNPFALHFDHLPGHVKISNLSRMLSNGSRSKILREIAKCEVVCANCHAVRTYARRARQKNSQQPEFNLEQN